MDRLDFSANFRAFAEVAELQTPLRLLLLAWVDLNWQQVSLLSQHQLNEFLAIAKSNIVSDRVTKEVVVDRAGSQRRADIPLVVIERVNNHIRTAYSQVAGDDVAIFERLMETLQFEEGDGGYFLAPRG